ncbi:hypothetical protein BT69DRAFT_1347547 [Atractiella rhizophila]|nr:hypothetical protein BT69DRAFT_1347547 [Atractiella rhizophila]
MNLNGLSRTTIDADAQLELHAAGELASHISNLQFKMLPRSISAIETKFHAYKNLIKPQSGMTEFIQDLPKRKDPLVIDTTKVTQLLLDGQEFSNSLKQLPGLLRDEELTIDLRVQTMLFARFVGKVEVDQIPIYFAKPPLLILQKIISAPKRTERTTAKTDDKVVDMRLTKRLKDITDVLSLTHRMIADGASLEDLRHCIDEYSGPVDWQLVYDDFTAAWKDTVGDSVTASVDWARFKRVFGALY